MSDPIDNPCRDESCSRPGLHAAHDAGSVNASSAATGACPDCGRKATRPSGFCGLHDPKEAERRSRDASARWQAERDAKRTIVKRTDIGLREVSYDVLVEGEDYPRWAKVVAIGPHQEKHRIAAAREQDAVARKIADGLR